MSRVVDPIPLVPDTMMGILDRAFRVLKRDTSTVLSVVAVFAAPLSLANVYLQRSALGDNFVEDFSAGLGSGPAPISAGLQVSAALLSSAQVSLVALALAPFIFGPYEGRSYGAGELLLATAKRLPALVVAWVCVHALQAFGLLAVLVGAFFVMAFTSLTVPALALGDVGPFRAIGESFRLASRQFLRILALVVLVALVHNLTVTALVLLPSLGAIALHDHVGPAAGLAVLAVATVLADLIVVTFVASAAVLMYLDARVRVDHLHVALRLDALDASA